MTNVALKAWFTIGIALLFIGFSVPLACRKIPMNHYYGFRTAEAFKSEQNWYDINAAGGKILLWASLPILAVGICKLFAPKDTFFYLNLTAIIGPIIIGFVGDRITRKK